MKNQIKVAIAGATSFLPLLAFAQSITFNKVQDALDSILFIANQYIIPIIVGLAIIYFLWGLLQYIRKAGDEGERSNAKWQMVYGIIIIFVMTAVWGLVNVLDDTLGLDRSVTPLPNIPQANPNEGLRR